MAMVPAAKVQMGLLSEYDDPNANMIFRNNGYREVPWEFEALVNSKRFGKL